MCNAPVRVCSGCGWNEGLRERNILGDYARMGVWLVSGNEEKSFLRYGLVVVMFVYYCKT